MKFYKLKDQTVAKIPEQDALVIGGDSYDWYEYLQSELSPKGIFPIFSLTFSSFQENVALNK